jgi:hypothetical protein
MTKPELKKLLIQNVEALSDLRPAYKVALKKAMSTPQDQGIITLPALNGWTFPNEVANAANQVLKKEGVTTGALSTAVNTANAMNNLYRGFRATLDNSALGIQGLLGMYGDPKAYAKALAVNIKAWGVGGDQILGKFLNEFDAAVSKAGRLASAEWATHGLHVGGATGEFALGQGIGSKVSSLPVVKQSNRAFGYFGDALRLQWADDELSKLLKNRTLEQITKSGDLERIASSANVMTGWAKGKTFGSVGDLVLFAPRWMQSRLETVAKAGMGLRPGAKLDQKIALRSLLKLIGAGVVMTVAANAAQGQETDFRPIVDGKRNSRFMKIKYKGNNYSLFGPWDSLLATFLYVGTGEPLKALRSSGSALTSAAFDLITGKDFNYQNTTDTPEHFAKWILGNFVPFSAGQLPEAVSQIAGGDVAGGVLNAGAQITGIKSYPVSETDALKELPGFISKLGGIDETGLADTLKDNEGATPAKLAEIREKDWTYDTAALKRDINATTRNLKPDAIETISKQYPIVEYCREITQERDFYYLLGEDERELFVKANPEFVVGQLFWGYWSDTKAYSKYIPQVKAMCEKYDVAYSLVPIIAKTLK